MKFKEKLASEYSKRYDPETFYRGTFLKVCFIAGFEAALKMAAELHAETGYGECLQYNDFTMIGEQEVE